MTYINEAERKADEVVDRAHYVLEAIAADNWEVAEQDLKVLLNRAYELLAHLQQEK